MSTSNKCAIIFAVDIKHKTESQQEIIANSADLEMLMFNSLKELPRTFYSRGSKLTLKVVRRLEMDWGHNSLPQHKPETYISIQERPYINIKGCTDYHGPTSLFLILDRTKPVGGERSGEVPSSRLILPLVLPAWSFRGEGQVTCAQVEEGWSGEGRDGGVGCEVNYPWTEWRTPVKIWSSLILSTRLVINWKAPS